MTTKNSSNASSPSTFRGNNVISSFHITMISDGDEMFDLWLPESTEGFFRISDRPDHRFLSIQGRDGKWIASCRKPAFFRNVPLEHSYATPLENGQLLYVDYDDRAYVLYVEKVSRDQRLFRNYSVHSNSDISIGSQAGNDIICKLPYISSRHAILKYSMQKWSVTDCGSQYGTFVNGVRTVSADLQLGDMLQLFGMRLIVGPGFFSLSSGSSDVEITSRLPKEEISLHGGYSRYQDLDLSDDSDGLFNRNPRKRMEINTPPICVEGPPMSMLNNQLPLMLRMGSSVVMGGAAALAGNFVTLLSSVMFPFISAKYTEKQRQDYEHLRLTKYTEYLEAKRKEIVRAIENEKQILNKKHPPLSQLVGYTQSKEHLWERRTVDSDFLEIRLGTGTLPLRTAIEYPPHRFELETDVLEEKMYQLVEAPYQVEQVPIVLTLPSTRVCGLLGSRADVVNYLLQLAFQVSTLHSYDEVKLFFFVNPQEQAVLEQTRYLPHTWDDPRTIRFFATDESESYRLGEYVRDQLENDPEGELTKVLRTRPYFLFFALDKKLFESHEIFKQILQADNMQGVSVIAAYDNLPKDSQKIITLNPSGNHVLTTMDVDGGNDVFFRMDYVNNQHLSSAMKLLMNTSLKTVAHSQEMPKMVTFLEMYSTGRIEQLNPMKRWAENNPTKSLAAPVGVGSDGSLFMLDLHEKRQGPHGLVAGMTGSGKSEFIITYILSMAINYHPDEVAFVLIDYKGGGLAGAFDNPQMGIHLPHLVGTITNLDGASIQRSLMSIESELLRRQRIFNEIKGAVNEGTMDIYAYQKLYRAGKVSQPMPHLFIISDEFAELKQQQPEFMEKLISAARIGRSLGVHLILATQKPTGVVNDQIRSNTKFRVCLRVQERSDSMDMLKRPEAAELTDTGRFYLQVGYNEYFAMGQSAWCGAPYEPQDSVPIQRDDSIEFLDNTGQVIAKSKPKPKKTDSGMKQIVAIVKYLSDLAERENIHSRPLWTEELPNVLDMDAVKEQYPENEEYTLSIGVLDDPTEQLQHPMQINFLRSRNTLIVGDSGCGKTTLVHNIIYSLSKTLAPKDFNFYVLDYSGRQTKIFSPLPHCGVVLYEEDENSLDAFFATIKDILKERKQLFSELEVDNFEAARIQKKIPLVLVAIDNYGGFAGTKKGDAMSNVLLGMLKESSRYGVKFIITCKRPNEASPRIKQSLEDRICMHLLDKYDYLELLGSRVKYVPPEIPGRGLVAYNERILEFQCATYWTTLDNQKHLAKMKSEIEAISKNYTSAFTARRLPVVSDNAEYKDFASQFSIGRIPLGYSKATGKPVVLPLKQYKTLCIYFGNQDGRLPITENVLLSAQMNNMEVWVIRRKENSIFSQDNCKVNPALLSEADYLSCSNNDAILLQKALIQTMKARKKMVNAFYERNGIDATQEESYTKAFSFLFEKTKPILLLIESLEDFMKPMSPILASSYESLFRKTWQRNIYVLACVDPDMPKESTENDLFNYLQKNEVLLFGGQLNRQQLCSSTPSEATEKLSSYNFAIMKYRKQYHPLSMPCGIIMEESENDDDMMSII